jgi:hypothetical protein
METSDFTEIGNTLMHLYLAFRRDEETDCDKEVKSAKADDSASLIIKLLTPHHHPSFFPGKVSTLFTMALPNPHLCDVLGILKPRKNPRHRRSTSEIGPGQPEQGV